MTAHYRLLACACMVLIGSATMPAAEQVQLHLTSGVVVEGELVSQDDEQVVVKSAYTTKKGISFVTLGYKRTAIASMVAQKDPEEEYPLREAAASSAGEHAALAVWCQGHGMAERAVAQAQRALALDAGDAVALQTLASLGWVQVDGAWVLESAWLAKQGKVRHRGQIMTIAEVAALADQERAAQAVTDAQKVVDDRTALVAALDLRLGALQKRPAQIEADLAKARAALTADQAAAARVKTTKDAFDAAEQALAQAQKANAAPNVTKKQNLTPLQTAAEDAQKAANAARREGAGAAADIPRVQARIKGLEDEQADLVKQHDDLTQKRVTAVADLAIAQTALDGLKADRPAPVPSP